MALFENFPYTNLHNLNLDWIVKTVKENNETVNELQEYVGTIDTQIQEKIDTEVPEAIAEAVESGVISEAILASKTRKYIFIGDSYAEGYTPDGNVTGFPLIVKNILGLTDNENFFNINRGGAGFGPASGSELAFDALLQSISATITDKDSITDIIFAGGYNDNGYTKTDILNGISRCRTFIKSNYTNPSLRVWLFAIGYNAKTPNIRFKLYDRYNDVYAKSFFIYRKLTKAYCKYDWFSSDGIHPSTLAQEAIAREIVHSLFGCADVDTPIYEEFVAISGGNIVTQMTPNFIRTFLWVNDYTYHFDTPVTINPSGEFKLFEFTSNLPLNSEENNTKTQTCAGNVIFHRQTSPTYVAGPVVFYIHHIEDNRWGLFLREFALNAAGSGYEPLNDVTDIIFPWKTPQFFIPYTF